MGGATASETLDVRSEHALIVMPAPTRNVRPSVEEARRLVAKAVQISHAVDMMRDHLSVPGDTYAFVRFVDSQHAHGFLPPTGDHQDDFQTAYLSIPGFIT